MGSLGEEKDFNRWEMGGQGCSSGGNPRNKPKKDNRALHWLGVHAYRMHGYIGFIPCLLLYSLKRDSLPLKEDSWRVWRAVSETLFPPTVFLSTAKISFAFWAAVLPTSMGVLHVSQMPNGQQGAQRQPWRLCPSCACRTQHAACMCTCKAHTHTHMQLWGRDQRILSGTALALQTRLRRLGTFFSANQAPGPICSLQSNKVNANFPFIIHVCGWAVCSGRNECSP